MLLTLRDREIDCTDRTAVMGILNVSDDSPVAESIVGPAQALERAIAMHEAGAELIDVGAHSTAEGARALTPQQEIERVCPVIEAIAREGLATSVDTWSAEVARAAAEAGVHLLNDVTAAADPAMVTVAVEFGLPLCIMHMRGEPQRHYEVDQTYAEIEVEVRAYLEERAATLDAAGVVQTWLDPGFAFGKSAADNLRLLGGLPRLVASGRPVLVSASRKGFLGELLGAGRSQHVPRLLEAALGFNTLAAWHGAHVVRVHDVAEVAAAMSVVNAARAQRGADAQRARP